MSPHEDRPVVTLYDRFTGRTATYSEMASWNWLHGNFSCDCNRGLAFDHGLPDTGYCVGCKRYVVIGVEPMPDGHEVKDFNEGYAMSNTEELVSEELVVRRRTWDDLASYCGVDQRILRDSLASHVSEELNRKMAEYFGVSPGLFGRLTR